MEESDSNGLEVYRPRDLAEQLRKVNPTLPEIWEGGPGKNQAARALYYRINKDFEKGIEPSAVKMEWYAIYTNATLRKRTSISITEEFGMEDEDSDTNKKLIVFLLNSIIAAKKEVNERTDVLHRYYQDKLDKKDERFEAYVEKQENRRDDHSMAVIELFAKDKDKGQDRTDNLYKNLVGAQDTTIKTSQTHQGKLFDSVTAILTSSAGLTEKYFNALKETIEKMESKMLEDFVRMVLFPMLPLLVPLIFKRLGIEVPDTVISAIGNIQSSLTEESK